MLNINSWNIDPSALWRWDNGWRRTDPVCNMRDVMFESKGGRYGCLVYSEYICMRDNYGAYCAIYEYKDDPKLLLNIKCFSFPLYAFWSDDEKYVFLKARFKEYQRAVLILDVENRKFSTVHVQPHYMDYEIIERGGAFEVHFTKKLFVQDFGDEAFSDVTIDCNSLEWCDWSVLESFEEPKIPIDGLKYLFADKRKLWRDTAELEYLGVMTKSTFVNLNREKKLYWCLPIVRDEFGHDKLYYFKLNIFDGVFLPQVATSFGPLNKFALYKNFMEEFYVPAFTSRMACEEYLNRIGVEAKVCKKSLKEILKQMDARYPLHEMFLVVDPQSQFRIPLRSRITPKSLRKLAYGKRK